MGHTKFLLLAQLRQRRRLLLSIIQLLLGEYFRFCKWRKLKKFRYKYLRHYQNYSPKPRHLIPRFRLRSNSVDVPFQGNTLFERSGMFEDDFEVLFMKLQSKIVSPRHGTKHCVSTILTPRARLLLALHWMKKYLYFTELGAIYSVSRKTAENEVNHTVPIVYAGLNEINWTEGIQLV